MPKKKKDSEQEYHSKKVKEWREEHRKKGLCTYCKNKALKGKTLCRYHADYFRFYKKFKKGG